LQAAETEPGDAPAALVPPLAARSAIFWRTCVAAGPQNRSRARAQPWFFEKRRKREERGGRRGEEEGKEEGGGRRRRGGEGGKRRGEKKREKREGRESFILG